MYNFPMINPTQFEGHGDGPGVSSQQDVADLNKALTAGFEIGRAHV